MALRNRLAEIFLPHSGNGNGKAVAVAAPAVPPSEAKAIPIIDPRIFHAQFVPLNANGEIVRVDQDALSWYATAWLAYACMRYRATKIVEAPIWITEENAKGEEEWISGDHPIAGLLEQPNPDMEMADLLELSSLYLDSTGQCLWVKNRDRGKRVGSLYPFSGTDFRVESANGRLFGRYRVQSKTGEITLEPEDVIHFRNASPADPHGAVSPLHAAAALLGIDRQMLHAISAGLRNAVVTGMSVEFDPVHMPLTADQLEEFAAMAARVYADARNHGKLFATNGKVQRHKLGFEGLFSGELGKEITAAFCACFQIPPVVIGAYVGLENSSDRHNLEASIRLVYDNATIPTWVRMERAITRGLLREIDPNPLRFVRFDRSKIKELQDDRNAAAEIVSKAEKALRVDDARTMLGLEPLGGDRGDAMLVTAAPAIDPAADPADPTDDDEKSAGRPTQRKERGDRWTLFDSITQAQALGWQLAAFAQLEDDREAVLRIADATLRPGQKDDDPFGPADPSSVRDLIRQVADHMNMEAAIRWRSRIGPLVSGSARQAVERVSTEMGLSFELLQPGLLDYTEREAAWLVTRVTDTTKEEIRNALAAGLEEGDAIPALRKRIQELGAFGPSRAELIARTETTRVYNGAQLESMTAYAADSGEKIQKTWIATRDARTRDEHAALDGETRGVDEAFSNGLQVPGEPNCRCTIGFELIS